MKELDVWRSAEQLIKMYGDEAIDMAVNRARQLADEGDKEGEYVMGRIAGCIEILQRPDADGMPIH